MNIQKITRIVLTGGPCGGKTTALAHLRERLEEMGYVVITIPEAATLCITAGLHPGIPVLQDAILGVGIDLENRLLQAVAKMDTTHKRGTVVLYDRGLVDGRAYSSETQFKALLAREGMHLVQARDERYGAVLHLVTAANGAEDSYTLSNNAARHETAAQARELDMRTQQAWVGHPHLRIIDNRTDFKGKLLRVYQEVCAVLGVPIPIEKERKFLVSFSTQDIPKGSQVIEIEQRYLMSDDPLLERRVRKRGQDGYYTYYLTEKRTYRPGERLETERLISQHEYSFGASMMCRDTAPVKKQRTCFSHEGQYFELDQYESQHALPAGADAILEIELTEHSPDVSIPTWIRVHTEVTDDSMYANAMIAKRLAEQS